MVRVCVSAYVQVDEYKAKLLAGSESSRAMREIRARDPSFDLNTFVRAIKVCMSKQQGGSHVHGGRQAVISYDGHPVFSRVL